MDEQMMNKLTADVRKLNETVISLGNSNKSLAVRIEILASIFSALVAAGLIKIEGVETIVNMYSSNDKRLTDDFLANEKKAVMKLIDSIKVR